MSYTIVKSIKIKEGRVYLRGYSNNVFPHITEEWEVKELSQLLREKGTEAVNLELLKELEKGNITLPRNHKLSKALRILKYKFTEEYYPFNWQNNWEASIINRKERKEEFNKLLLKALRTPIPKERYVIATNYIGKKYYGRMLSNRLRWVSFDKATLFMFEEEAQAFKNRFEPNNDMFVEVV